ncbi:helix-turn-helix transcriptional regulator [Pandoraea terrae]|uniref:Helix-turn-helix transcriptional regulator n=1 Tax=Pandoraea terrae TaxID=1537710 RepID=A0A5E4S0J0_9BURK|nr:helix-turn-helix transcriptional regulator [Pandoraea terrae]VVD68641.1 helix-turn-helix transcriptional regulator [Pandoraea terrae]
MVRHKSALAAQPASTRHDGALALSLESFGELLHLIQRGPLSPVPWQDALQWLGKHLHANWVTLMLRPQTVDRAGLVLVAQAGSQVRGAGAYSQHGYALDPFVKLPPDRIMSIDEVIDDKTWRNSEFFRQFLAPYDIAYMLGVDFRTEDRVDCHFRICRASTEAPFSEADRAFCAMLLPHLKLSVHMHSLIDGMESERKLYAGAVDRMMVGTVVLDETGAIVSTNSVAEEIFAERDGLTLSHGAIRIAYTDEARQFQDLQRKAMAMPAETGPVLAEAMSITRPSGKTKLGMVLRSIPLAEWSEGKRRPAVAIFIRDPERKSQASEDILKRLFGLTSAEATLAVMLANGLTLDEAVYELDIRKNTGRAHLRAIFSKTGVRRQTMLVHLVLSSVAQLV